MVPDEIEPRGRDQRRELLDQLLGLEDHGRRAVGPSFLQTIEQAAVVEARQSLARQGRAGDVAAQALEAPASAARKGWSTNRGSTSAGSPSSVRPRLFKRTAIRRAILAGDEIDLAVFGWR
jgi:hypothetical protein